MEKNNNKLILIIAVCLAIAVVVLSLALFLRGCGDESNENSTDVSVNTEISETVSDTSTDEISDEISAEESTPEESIPAEHTHEYSDKWSSNETDHWYECECGEKSDIANHTFGEWETTKEATEDATGSKKHTCSVCGYEETATIPMLAHTHEYSNEWSSNETDHWKECKCGDKSSVTSHTYGDWTVTKEATEETAGSKYHTCSGCSYKETVVIPVLAHTHKYADKWSNNETDHWKECKCGDKSGVANHNYGNWTTTKEATEETEGSKYHTCNTCGYKETVKIPVLSHTHSFGGWKNNDTSHWKECKCGGKSEFSAHTYGAWTTTKEATCTATGTKKHTCTACGYSETATIPVIAHTYGDWKSNATSHWKECKCGDKVQLSSHTYGAWTTTKEATCTETGTKKHTCTACNYSETATIPVIAHTYGDWKTNATSHWKECKCGDKTQLSSHTYGDWVITKDATCTETGTKKHTCTACGYTETATIPVIAHTYGEWKNDGTNHWKECKCGNVSEKANHNYTSVVTPPTESEQGYTTHICDKCGYNYVDSYTDPASSVSEGLAYQVNEDGVTCTIIGIGTCKDTNLKIPPEIDGYKVTAIGNNAFYKCTSIISASVPDSVTTIEAGAFAYCNRLASVNIGNGVTEFVDGAFQGCNSLTSVIIPDSVTTIGNDSFAGCTSLTSIIIPDSVTTIGDYAFESCKSLTSITIPDSVTHIGYKAFHWSTNLQFNVYDNAYYLGNSNNPYRCLITSVNDQITSCEIHPDTEIIAGGAFSYNKNLANINIPKAVSTICYRAFANCIALTNLTIPDSVMMLGEKSFESCAGLTHVTINAREIGIDAFDSCSALVYITIGNNVSIVRSGAFNLPSKWRVVYYQGDVLGWLSIKFENGSSNPCWHSSAFYLNEKKVTDITIPDSVTSIGDYAFIGCTSLTSVIVPDSVITIGDSAFRRCTSLKSIAIPDSVTTIGVRAFEKGTSLTSVTIGARVTMIGWYAFSNCDSLTSITFKDTSGWYVAGTEGASSGTNIDVSSPSTAAKYLKNTYLEYYWYKK